MAEPDLESELDRLYALPLAEFIAARNELAKRLRTAGERQTADRVKTLAKPSVTAWAANALYHHERERFDALLDAAAAVRAALAGRGDRRKVEAARRKALQALLADAAKLLARAGHAATPANRQRISHTLEALAAREPAATGPRAGRLTADLELQGFDVLAGLAASLAPPGPAAGSAATRSGKPTAKTAPVRAPAAARDRRLDAARQRVDERQTELARLDREAEEAEATASEVSERHERLAEEAAETARRARAAADAAATAKQEMAAARAAAGKARAARRRGLSRLETAKRQLERLEG